MVQHKVDYLTDTQERILRVIREAIVERGEAPSLVEIGAAVGLRSRSSVHYQLRELEAKGAIRREPGRPRGIRLT
jgi:SOS-response transcriptional repressor LexA